MNQICLGSVNLISVVGGESKITFKSVSQMKFVVLSLFTYITPARFTTVRAAGDHL